MSINSYQQQTPVIASLTNTEREECLKKPLIMHYRYQRHSLSMERQVELVAEASGQVVVIRQKN